MRAARDRKSTRAVLAILISASLHTIFLIGCSNSFPKEHCVWIDKKCCSDFVIASGSSDLFRDGVCLKWEKIRSKIPQAASHAPDELMAVTRTTNGHPRYIVWNLESWRASSFGRRVHTNDA